MSSIISKRKSEAQENIIKNKDELEDFEQGEKYLTLTVSKNDFKKWRLLDNLI